MQRLVAFGLFALLLLPFGGCGDVPLDTATYRTDTLVAVGPGLGENKRDTIPTPYGSTVPKIDWKMMTFTWVRLDGDPRTPPESVIDIALSNARVRLDTVIIAGQRVEGVRVYLQCELPDTVGRTSVALADGGARILPARMKFFELNVPFARIPTQSNPNPTVKLEKSVDDSDLGGASITIVVDGRRTVLETGDSSDGVFKVVRINRRTRLIHAKVYELKFNFSDGPKRWYIPLGMEFTFSY